MDKTGRVIVSFYGIGSCAIRSIVVQVKAAQVAPTGFCCFHHQLKDRSIPNENHVEIPPFSTDPRRQGLDNFTVLRMQAPSISPDDVAFNELKQSAETQHKESQMYGHLGSRLTFP